MTDAPRASGMSAGGVAVTVYGIPAPQGSKSVRSLPNGRVALYDSSKKTAPWRKAVTAAFGIHREPWADGPVEVEVTFYLPRGRTVRRRLPSTPPDLDKLLRSTLDGITDSGVIVDDRLVVRITASKEYADGRPPGAEILLKKVAE